MKKYKLLKELPTFKAGEVFRLKDGNLYYYPAENGTENAHWADNIIAYHHKTLEKFPNILEEWFEEVEEPKAPDNYWFVNDLTGEPMNIKCSNYFGLHKYIESIRLRKEFINYFETEEEAKLAVRKLQAWKRLKDKGFEFDSTPYCSALCGNGFEIYFSAIMPPEFWNDNDVKEDLILLFGGEE